jgi:hypothetical protein
VHQSKPFNSLNSSGLALVGGSLFTLKKLEEETQEKKVKIKPSEQTLRAEAVQSIYNKNRVNTKPVF